MIESWLFWAVISYLSGAIPYALVIGRLLLHKDIRQYGDGNPGATNVLRAGGGLPLTALAVFLDGLKGLLPVGLANWGVGINGWQLVVVALMPIIGHATSPLLRFKGGKAVAVTFGSLCALTIWEGPTVLGLLLALWFKMISNSGWAVMLALLSTTAYFLLAHCDPVVIGTLIGAMLLLALTHRADLRQAPALRPDFKASIDALPIWRSR
jgi:acyl phosphate:glycerol-3-phosphate acyltransferase